MDATMAKTSRRAYPVTVSQLPVVRCQVCGRSLAHRPGQASRVLTEHYAETHPAALRKPLPARTS
jgi:hypothetical protein